MSWTCHKCGKTYQKQNQYHICAEAGIDEVLRYDSASIGLYHMLLNLISEFGEFETRVSTKSITLVKGIGFALVYPRRKAIDICLFLNDEVDHPSIHKIQQYSKNRYLHTIRIREPDELSNEVLQLVKQAYDLKDKQDD